MFFQYNPGAAVWGDMHWGHAVSADMIHWKHLPVALAPTPGWDDADGCFTGSAVNDGGTATILYTGVKTVAPEHATLRDGQHTFRETQCLATSDDPQLRTWTKWKTPVLQPPNDPELPGFRDPFAWRGDDGWWYMGVASGKRKQGGCVLLYRSKNLREWEFMHPLATGEWIGHEGTNPVDTGEMWECPDFFPIGKKHVLLYSTAGKVMWETGELDRKEMRFHRERSGLLDHDAYYAQKTQAGEPLLWGWIPERRPDSELIAAGWAGCMALPRALSLDEQGNLQMDVAKVAESLRGKSFELRPETITGAPQELIHKLRDITIEGIAGEFQWKTKALPFALAIEDNDRPWWTLQARSEGGITKLEINKRQLEFQSGDAGELECRLFLDGSVAEFFCNRRHVLTSRIYRKPAGPLHVKLQEGDARAVETFRAWQLKPISADRFTS
jgi:beta-fructofuranosidase